MIGFIDVGIPDAFASKYSFVNMEMLLNPNAKNIDNLPLTRNYMYN